MTGTYLRYHAISDIGPSVLERVLPRIDEVRDDIVPNVMSTEGVLVDLIRLLDGWDATVSTWGPVAEVRSETVSAIDRP